MEWIRTFSRKSRGVGPFAIGVEVPIQNIGLVYIPSVVAQRQESLPTSVPMDQISPHNNVGTSDGHILEFFKQALKFVC